MEIVVDRDDDLRDHPECSATGLIDSESMFLLMFVTAAISEAGTRRAFSGADIVRQPQYDVATARVSLRSAHPA